MMECGQTGDWVMEEARVKSEETKSARARHARQGPGATRATGRGTGALEKIDRCTVTVGWVGAWVGGSWEWDVGGVRSAETRAKK